MSSHKTELRIRVRNGYTKETETNKQEFDVNAEIESVLRDIEQTNGVRIPFACESGSRAWGFASKDSDYDVRFIYVRPTDWYLAVDLEKKRDVIERPIDDVLDVSGWDLRKALGLLRKSNPPLLEWLGSPIVYRDDGHLADKLKRLAEDIYSPRACMFHYLHMARANAREFLGGELVWRKKYFYVLRPLLAIRWLQQDRGIAPTEFGRLVDACVENDALRAGIAELVKVKEAGAELDRGPRIPVISDFIEEELSRLDTPEFSDKPPLPPVEPLNAVFRDELRRLF